MTKKEEREIRDIMTSLSRQHPSYSTKRRRRIAEAVVYRRKRQTEVAREMSGL